MLHILKKRKKVEDFLHDNNYLEGKKHARGVPVSRQADKESKLIEFRTAGLFVYIISNDIKEKPGAPPF